LWNLANNLGYTIWDLRFGIYDLKIWNYMFVRIVKLTFQEDKIAAFLENFNEIKHQIRSFEGNEFLELYQDKQDARVFFTYSYWKDEKALENYRKSAFFSEVWSYTKTLFAEKPEAWSVNKLETLL
jgi:heme-degrading monooxygenase HmoA